MSTPSPYSAGPGREPDDPWATSSTPQAGYPPASPSHYPPSSPPGWGPPVPHHHHPQGTPVLVVGILSVVGITVLGPVAWVMGRNALKEIDASDRPVANRGHVLAGTIMGIIATAFLALGVVGLVVFLGFLALVMV